MNILPQLRNPAVLVAMAIAAPIAILVGGGFRFPAVPLMSLGKDISFDLAHVGVVDELQSVRANLVDARHAMDDGNYLLAGRLAEDAQIGALVAERHAQSTLARKDAQDFQNSARLMRARIALKTQPGAIAGN